MDIIIRTGFESIKHKIHFQPQTEQKGKKLVLAQHVREVEELRTKGKSFLIRALIIRQTSVTQTPYKTSLNINDERFVTNVKCDCVYNQSGKCKHVAALIYYINTKESLSKTSSEQQWGKPSTRQFVKNKYTKGRYFEEMFPPVTKNHTRNFASNEVQPILLAELDPKSPLKLALEAAAAQSKDASWVKEILVEILNKIESNLERKDCIACLKFFFMNREECEIYQKNYILDKQLKQFYHTNVVLSDENIIKISCDTIKQSACPNWYAIRQVRISASTNVHCIKTRTTKSIESLVSNMLNPKKVDCAATQYGLRCEQKALEEYEKLHQCEVKRVGVIINKVQPWLCASVDGVVVKDGCVIKLVEVKCPISCKNKPVVNFETNLCNVIYLEFKNYTLELKKSKPYYTQIQTQMYVTGMTMCDIFIYSPIKNGSVTIEVNRDEKFIEEIILKSENFYFQHYLPALYTISMDNNNENFNNINQKATRKRDFTGKNIFNCLNVK